MSTALLKALILLVPTGMLLAGSAVLCVRRRNKSPVLQLLGAGCLMVVVLTHVADALNLFPWMGWGIEDSVGHYLDSGSVALGLLLFPTGYLLYALTTRTDQ